MRLTAIDFLAQKKRLVLAVLIGLALLQFIVQASVLTKGVGYVASWLTIDDTYYYLQTAWNVKQYGFPTFDGIHSTNGVQLLWFWIVVLIALFLPSKTALLFATLIACFLLNALCYLMIWRLGELMQRSILSLCMASLWALLSFGSNAYSIGLENSLHAFVFWCAVWQVVRFLVYVHKNRDPNWLGLAIVLTLNVWTRLDAALFSVLLYGLCVARALVSPHFKLRMRYTIERIVGASLLAFLGLALQLGAFQWMGGSYLPVSALIKMSWGAVEPEALQAFMTLGTPPVLHNLPIGPIGLVALIVAGLQLAKSHGHREEWRALKSVWYCLLVGSFLQLVAVASVAANFIWYQSPSFIFWIITFSIIIDRLENVAARKSFPAVFQVVSLGICFLIIVVSSVQFARRLVRNSISAGHPLYTTRYGAALWMAENLSPDAICGSWNAGQLGFFSERRIVNLDGLINNADYYNQVIRGNIPLVDYIYENEMDCIVDHNDEMVPPDFVVVKVFSINDAAAIQIWQVPLR